MDVSLSRHRHCRGRAAQPACAAKLFFRKALERHGRPDRVVNDGSQTNHEAIVSCDTTNRLQDCAGRRLKTIHIRRSQYLNNRIEQDHRRIKRRVRPMLGFKSTATASTILSGIDMIHMMRKRQARYAFNANPSLAEHFEILAAYKSALVSWLILWAMSPPVTPCC